MSRILGRLAPFFKFSLFSITRRLSGVWLPPRAKGHTWCMWCFFPSYLSPFRSLAITARATDLGMYLDRLRPACWPRNRSARRTEIPCSWDGMRSVRARIALRTNSERQKTIAACSRFRRNSLAPSRASRRARSQYTQKSAPPKKMTQSALGFPVT